MFGSLFGRSKQDQKFRDTIDILNQLYLLTFTTPKYPSEIQKFVNQMGDKFNEHEIAIVFLASYSSHIKRDHPQAEIEVKKYISRAKGAYDRGLARDPMPREYLFSVVSERFGIDPSAVPAK